MTDNREPQRGRRPQPIPGPDDPAVFIDTPERDPAGRHLIPVGIALAIMIVAWWGL